MERWNRERAVALSDPLQIDELGELDLLILDGVGAEDEGALAWCRRAPTIVLAVPPPASAAPTEPDLVVVPGDDRTIEMIQAAIEVNPSASLTLLQELRIVERLDPVEGLRVESLAYSMLLAGPEFTRWFASRPLRSASPYAGEAVRVERTGDDVRITLARPARRNAFSKELRDELFEALSFVAVDTSVQRVRLDAEGPNFCSGGDLEQFGTAADVVAAHEVRIRRSIGALLAGLTATVVATVHGPCVGAGVELPSFADTVIARPDTTFRLPEVGMGLIPGAGGTVGLTRRIGRQATARLALVGEEIGADAALGLGLVDRIEAS